MSLEWKYPESRGVPKAQGGGCSLRWCIRGCAAEQAIVFVLSVLNRVYNFAKVCLKQCTCPLICRKQGNKFEGFFLNRVRFQTLSGSPILNYWSNTLWA